MTARMIRTKPPRRSRRHRDHRVPRGGRTVEVDALADGRVILDAIRCIVRELRESSRAAESEVGVSGAQLFVLHKLAALRVASVNQLAEATLTHQSSVSAVVSRLAVLGLVARQRSAIDGRQIDVTLTRRGMLLSRRAPEAAQEHLMTAIASMEPTDRRRLGGLLRQLTVTIAGDRPAPMFFEDAPNDR